VHGQLRGIRCSGGADSLDGAGDNAAQCAAGTAVTPHLRICGLSIHCEAATSLSHPRDKGAMIAKK